MWTSTWTPRLDDGRLGAMARKSPAPVLAFQANKGGVGKTTACHHMAWHLAEQGSRILIVCLDEQTDIIRRFFGDVPDGMADGEIAMFDEGGQVQLWAGRPEDFEELALDGYNMVLVDTARSRAACPRATHVLIFYDGPDSLANNGDLVQDCTDRGIPFRRVAWRRNTQAGAMLTKWAREKGADEYPATIRMRLTAERCEAIWQIDGAEITAKTLRRLCDGWSEFAQGTDGEVRGARHAHQTRADVREPRPLRDGTG